MTKDFQKLNIPKLPVFTTEEGIKTIKEFFGKLILTSAVGNPRSEDLSIKGISVLKNADLNTSFPPPNIFSGSGNIENK